MGEKQPTQAEKFRKAARDLDCEDSEQAFDAKLRSIAKQKPKDEPAGKGRRRVQVPKDREH